jgi:hypothetical protein
VRENIVKYTWKLKSTPRTHLECINFTGIIKDFHINQLIFTGKNVPVNFRACVAPVQEG